MKTTLLLALTLTAGSAFAQQAPAPAATTAVDARFAAWLGCWRLEDDLAGTGARMCITPEKNGVRLQTIVGTNKGIDELVIPDGVAHPIADAECKGTERAEFSADNLRVFRTTEVACGKESPRNVRSIAFMSGSSWINVQHVSGEKANTAVRVERYRRASNQQLADGSKAPQGAPNAVSAAAAADARWSVEDVVEASAKMPAEAVQAALAELKTGFDLNKKTLVALNQSGVHAEVIDLMIALTYPKRFVIERRGGGVSMPSGISTGLSWLDPLMTPMMMGAFSDCFSPYGYGYRTYYSMCGMYSPMAYDYYYSPYSYYNRYNYGQYGWVDLSAYQSVSGGGSAIGVEPAPEGRVVRGQGFTQIRSRDPEPAPRTSGNGGNGTAWAGSGSGASSGQGFSSGSSSSGSSSGSSGSSSGDSGARVAVPKGPGL